MPCADLALIENASRLLFGGAKIGSLVRLDSVYRIWTADRLRNASSKIVVN